MEAFLEWGIDLIVSLQQIRGPVLDSIFYVITFLGEEEFYLLLLPLLFWCVDFGLGARLAFLFLFSSYLNVNLKALFQQPRPFDLNPSLQLSSAEGYGLPSNHSQSAVVVWGSIAAWTRKTWFWITSIGLMVLVGFSRIYLGVHFPTDVLAGWMLGVLLLSFYLTVLPEIEKRLVRLSLNLQMFLVFFVSLGLVLIHPLKDTTTTMGALAGMGVGLTLMNRYVSFSSRGLWWQRAVRFFVGGIGVFALYAGLKAVSPSEGTKLYLVFRFLRYGSIGLWISLGAPWLFQLLQLTPKNRRGA